MSEKISRLITIDGFAISLSGACIVHCLCLPILISVLPIMEIWVNQEWVHKLIVLLALPTTGLALINIAQRRFLISVTMIIGIVLLLIAAFIPALHDHETPLTVSGAIILAGGHVLRWRTGKFLKT